jgi:hypothetical protein
MVFGKRVLRRNLRGRKWQEPEEDGIIRVIQSRRWAGNVV